MNRMDFVSEMKLTHASYLYRSFYYNNFHRSSRLAAFQQCVVIYVSIIQKSCIYSLNGNLSSRHQASESFVGSRVGYIEIVRFRKVIHPYPSMTLISQDRWKFYKADFFNSCWYLICDIKRKTIGERWIKCIIYLFEILSSTRAHLWSHRLHV